MRDDVSAPGLPAIDRWTDVYVIVHGVALFGYTVLGKTFAYIGVNQLFIGELILLFGLIVFLRVNKTLATLAPAPSLYQALLMGWVLLRTVPFIGEFGKDALRDSVIIMYGGLAFIIIALMLEDARLDTLLGYYRRVNVIHVMTMPVLGTAAVMTQQELPQIPGTGLPILFLRPGDLAVHLAGAVVFVLVGLWRIRSGFSFCPVTITRMAVHPVHCTTIFRPKASTNPSGARHSAPATAPDP